MKFDKVMLESYLYTCDLNLYGVGSPRYVPSVPQSKRVGLDKSEWKSAAEETPETMFDPTGKHPIDPELLYVLGDGASRFERYFDLFVLHSADRTEAKRPETEVSLKAVDGDGIKGCTS